MKRIKFKLLRVNKGLTQTDLANILGVSVSTVNLIENGKVRGSQELWLKLQTEFNLDGKTMWELQNPRP